MFMQGFYPTSFPMIRNLGDVCVQPAISRFSRRRIFAKSHWIVGIKSRFALLCSIYMYVERLSSSRRSYSIRLWNLILFIFSGCMVGWQWMCFCCIPNATALLYCFISQFSSPVCSRLSFQHAWMLEDVCEDVLWCNYLAMSYCHSYQPFPLQG